MATEPDPQPNHPLFALADTCPELMAFRVRYAPLRCDFVSAGVRQFTGHSAAEIVASPELLLARIHPEDRDAVRESTDGTEPDGATELSVRWLQLDGKVVWTVMRCRPLFDGAGHIDGLDALVLDVSARRRAEEALSVSDGKYRRLFDDNPLAMWVVDVQTRGFLAVNEAAVRQYGYSASQFTTMRITDIRADSQSAVIADLARARSGVAEFATRHRLRDGRVIDVEVVSHTQEFEGRPAVLSLIQDVTQRLAVEREMAHRSFHDPLTGLPNRELFLDRLRHALHRSRRPRGALAAVLFVDVDRFKTVNDGVGHAIGDALLKALADRLAAVIRGGDTLARLGGDEFAVLLDGTADAGDALRSARRLLDSCTEPFSVDGHTIALSLSVGVATAQRRGTRAEDIFRDAELAMYAAKTQGRGQLVQFTPDMRAAAVEGLSLDQDLRLAVEREELRLVFQPVVDVDGGAVVGCEALVRWEHPSRGLVPPDVFIPVAEEIGVITDVDTWVLNRACQQMAAWREQGLGHLFVAVNISGLELGTGCLVARVDAALAATGIPAHCLEIELTESVASTQPAAALHELDSLRQRGVSVSIDDFGTGYSSLSKLAMLSIDRLKVDRSFLAAITKADAKVPLVSAMIALAHELGLGVIAEGVETPAQLAFLHRHGCDLFQGYLVSPAVPAEQFAARCATGAARHRRPTLQSARGRRGAA